MVKRKHKEPKITATKLKMEAMALLTLARELYGDDADLSIEIKVNGTTKVRAS